VIPLQSSQAFSSGRDNLTAHCDDPQSITTHENATDLHYLPYANRQHPPRQSSSSSNWKGEWEKRLFQQAARRICCAAPRLALHMITNSTRQRGSATKAQVNLPTLQEGCIITQWQDSNPMRPVQYLSNDVTGSLWGV
jgi:hypothetical protein